MVTRCHWPGLDKDPVAQQYHDHEWGKLNLDERYLYEMMVLESFQSGLSWSTILHKRDNFRRAFADFDIDQVAAFSDQDQKRLMNDAGIVRNRLKINAAINNARVIQHLHQQGKTLAEILHHDVPRVIVNHPQDASQAPAKTALSTKIAKELKKDGFRFVGPTTTYSFLQAVGLINDHQDNCSFKYHD